MTIITEDEKIHNREFFLEHFPKTPERYMRIRNYMIQCWKKQKPKYVSKTAARRGLKDCGDVNAIGRVHDYLERTGIINVDCSDERTRVRKRVTTKRHHADLLRYQEKYPESAVTAMRLSFNLLSDVSADDHRRRRRVRNQQGEWVNEKEMEGKTYVYMTQEEAQRLAEMNSHYLKNDHTSTVSSLRKRKISTTRCDFYNDSILPYDPFMLVSPRRYAKDYNNGLRVRSHISTFLMMDLHAHLAETEVIGLLGGCFDDQTSTIDMIEAFPCNSVSTGLQCEMDPASEIEARSHFSTQGLTVVGWYHSHPCFEPDPSIRDIENQTQYQALFRRENGTEPFVGVIIMPYDPNQLRYESRIEMFHVSHDWNVSHTSRIPYSCENIVLLPMKELPPLLFDRMIDLVLYYRKYEYRVDLSHPFRLGDESVIRLEKLIKSLKSHLVSTWDAVMDLFFQKLQEAIIKLTFPIDLQPHHLDTIMINDPSSTSGI
jgi:protein MYSM1